MIATCNNGGGEFSVRVRSSDPSKTLCDGEFHNVKVSKRSRTLTVTLDGETDSYTTTTATTSADTKAPIFIGGVPSKFSCRKRIYLFAEEICAVFILLLMIDKNELLRTVVSENDALITKICFFLEAIFPYFPNTFFVFLEEA